MQWRAMDSGIQFAGQPPNRNTAYSRPRCFVMFCEGAELFAVGPETMTRGIEHGLAKPNHPLPADCLAIACQTTLGPTAKSVG